MTDCPTLQEAVLAWQRLPPGQKIRATVKLIGGLVYTRCDVPLGPGVFGRVLGRLSDVLEASGVTQEEIKRYAQSALHAGWDDLSADEKTEVCSAKTKTTIESLDKQIR